MKTVRFGKTGLKVSKLCLGTMTLGSRDWKPWALDEAESKPILKQALDCGFTFFDMADWYSTGAEKESNWLPAPAGNFSLYIRAYWGQEGITEGTWIPPGMRNLAQNQ